MALVVVATPGDANANSYCTLAQAESYHEARGFNEAWTDADETAKNAALVWGTRLLEQLDFAGGRVSSTQALRWPRVGVTDLDGYLFSSDAVPACVRSALAELALYLLEGDRTKDQGAVPISEVSVPGAVAVKFNVVPGSTGRRALPPAVLDLLKPVLRTGAGLVARLERA